MTNCLLKEEVISIVSAVLDNEWLLINHCPCTHTFRHIHTLLSRKVPKVKLGKVQFCGLCCWKLPCEYALRTHTHIYSMTKPLSLSGHCLPSPQTTMHVDCLPSFLIWPQTILHFISKSIKVFPQERFHANVDKRSTGLTAALCLWSDRKICSLWKNACHREGKSLNSEWNTVFIFHWTLKGKFTPFTNRDTKKWQTVSDFVNIFLRCQTWMRRDWLWK